MAFNKRLWSLLVALKPKTTNLRNHGKQAGALGFGFFFLQLVVAWWIVLVIEWQISSVVTWCVLIDGR